MLSNPLLRAQSSAVAATEETEKVADRLRELLRSHGRSVRWLAQQTGMPLATLQVQVAGKSRMTAETMIKSANALGVSLDFLATGKLLHQLDIARIQRSIRLATIYTKEEFGDRVVPDDYFWLICKSMYDLSQLTDLPASPQLFEAAMPDEKTRERFLHLMNWATERAERAGRGGGNQD